MCEALPVVGRRPQVFGAEGLFAEARRRLVAIPSLEAATRQRACRFGGERGRTTGVDARGEQGQGTRDETNGDVRTECRGACPECPHCPVLPFDLIRDRLVSGDHARTATPSLLAVGLGA